MTVAAPDLTSLLAAVRAGDGTAWGHLLEHVRPYLSLLVAAQLGRRLLVKADPADLVQDALLQAHRKFAAFAGTTGAEFAAWMEAILASRVEKLVRQFYGTARRDLRLERELADEFAASSRMLGAVPADPHDTPGTTAADREQAMRVAAAVARLADDHRAVIVFRHLDALTFPDIAARMGRTTDAVTHLWVRAVRRLRELLEGTA